MRLCYSLVVEFSKFRLRALNEQVFHLGIYFKSRTLGVLILKFSFGYLSEKLIYCRNQYYMMILDQQKTFKSVRER